MSSQSQTYITYVGSYAAAAEAGIHAFALDSERRLTRLNQTSDIENPSFIAIDESSGRLFAASEQFTTPGNITVYSVESTTGALTPINSATTLGASPCNIGLHPNHQMLVATNYSSGSVVAYKIGPDGRLSAASTQVVHEGRGPNPNRQEAPHPHAAVFDPSGQFVMVPDLGLDKIVIYRCDVSSCTLSLHAEQATNPGAGPRLIVFHQNGRYAYVINELDSTISVYHYTSNNGALESVQVVATLPSGFNGENTAAHIALTADGRHLYASNRGHDSITRFEINAADGTLTALDHVSTEGKTPRHFAITPDGGTMLVANQESDNITVFAVHSETGELKFTGTTIAVNKPTCIAYLPA